MHILRKRPGLIASIDSALDIAQVAAACRKVAAVLGFQHFMYGFRAPVSLTPCQFVLSGYPPAWCEHYDRRGYFAIDPVVVRALSTVLPFAWDEVDWNTPAVARLFEDAASFGLRYGLSVPVHGAHGESGVLSLARSRPPLPKTTREREQLFQRAQWFSAALHEKVRALVSEDAAPAGRLTRRERECLSLAAEGQSARAIGRNLKISGRTVAFHLGNAKHKLGASRRDHAVARAVALGQIDTACYPPAHFSQPVRRVQVR